MPDPATARRLGDYELIEEIARGGMGVVYRARQASLHRTVAVKLLHGGQFASPSFLQRFRREAEAAASLNHPNIVSIHEVGEEQGQPFFSMELIEGRSLADLVRDQPLPARQAAQLLKTIAETVHYAHERGVLHRDLKPSNVLLDAAGVPHVTDFGLAKRFNVGPASRLPSAGVWPAKDRSADPGEPPDEAGETPALLSLTLTGQVLGSPNYMPPEQADPKRGPTTAASDVYSLGAILYQLLTGRAPFMAETLTQTLRLVVESEAVSARLLSPGVPRDLETICARCLEKDPRRRYATARELADELGRFLADEPIQARPISAPARLARWCRRKPALASALGAGVVLLLVIAIGSPIAIVRIEHAREAAEAARKQEAGLRARAESAERATEQQLYTALLEQARATMVTGEMGHRVRALDALRRAAAISNSTELRREVMTALTLPDLRFERELSFASGTTVAVPDPAFERFAINRGPGPIEIRTLPEDRLLATLPASTNLPAFTKVWSADGRFLAAKRNYPDGGRHADWEVWDVADARRALLLQNVSYYAFSFHPRLPRVIARVPTGAAIWNLEDGRELVRFPSAGRPVILSFSPDGNRFAAFSPRRQGADGGRRLTVHDATNPEAAELAANNFKDEVNTIAWHPDGRSLVAPDQGGAVHWVDAQTGQMELLGRHKFAAVQAIFSPDGAYLLTGGFGKNLICWDARTKRRLFTANLEERFQLSTDGRRCATLTQTSIELFTFQPPVAHRELAGELGVSVRRAAFSPDGRWLAASGDKGAGVWDLSNDAPGAFDRDAYETDFYFAPDGQELFGSRSQSPPACFRWRLTSATNDVAPPVLTRLPLRTPKGLTTLSLVSNSVVMTSSEGSQILAPGENAPDTNRWTSTSPGINGVSPDGRWLGIRRHFGSTLYVYRLPELKEVAKLTHPFSFGDFRFSPGGDEVAIASDSAGDLLTFWNTTTWEQTRAVTNFSRVLYTPDARALWLGKDWQIGGLYDARTLEPRLLLPTDMFPLALSPDGQRVAVSVDAQRLQLWDLVALREQFRRLGLDWGRE